MSKYREINIYVLYISSSFEKAYEEEFGEGCHITYDMSNGRRNWEYIIKEENCIEFYKQFNNPDDNQLEEINKLYDKLVGEYDRDYLIVDERIPERGSMDYKCYYSWGEYGRSPNRDWSYQGSS